MRNKVIAASGLFQVCGTDCNDARIIEGANGSFLDEVDLGVFGAEPGIALGLVLLLIHPARVTCNKVSRLGQTECAAREPVRANKSERESK